ncbi:hypothetical protein PGT21_001444 [Puccinia graminis f. sp. tritici]|uniref:BZIP domain-containing protein n=1 Tax=Puccinia graminis f. sp. tritici TaxID=56615 RepID=A0A5B0QSB1_PUCGR|nr:hypothetical protein PGT21_001444 [Puccinia graminis f. sp. tritici]KAA1134746.1 hypothetical protein PGTUg99_013567 [Puccinia graminis f. sp. tritici]
MLPLAGSDTPSPPSAGPSPMASQSLSATKNLSRHSLRSLAPLLNDLPPPSFSTEPSSRRPAHPEQASSQAKNSNLPIHLNLTYSQPPTSPPTLKPTHQPHQQRPMIKTSSLDSSSGQSESPPTPSGHHLHSMSPSSYHAYRPEWTSVSSPILASSFDHPDYQAAPPSKRHRQLLNPELRSPFRIDPQDHTDTHQHPASNPLLITNSTSDPQTHHPLKPHSGSCSPSSREADESSNLQRPNDHVLRPHTYSHLVTLPHPILLDEDRSLCSRPLKNTKRAAQNRAAQRAFRERKDRYVRELEARSVQLEEYMVRYGLLEERERNIAAREAELINTASQSAKVDDNENMNRKPTTRDEEKLNHINRLEHQLESSREEIARLRAELMKFHHEEIDQNRRRVMDWERGAEDVSLPRTGSASDADTDAQTPCSSGSASAVSASKKTTGPHYQRSWSRDNQNTRKNGGTTEPTGRVSMRFAQKAHGNRRPVLSITTESQNEPILTQEYSRNGWSDEGESPDSLSRSHHQTYCARPEIACNQFEQIHHHRQQPFASQCTSENHNQASTTKSHLIPLRRVNKLDGKDQCVRLPGIQCQPTHVWKDEKRSQ